MNESILKALMRLFAIVANVSKNASMGNERDIVIDYLERQYSHEIVLKFIEYFDEQVQLYRTNNEHVIKIDNDASTFYNQSYIADLCNQINVELEHEQKQIALVYLLDYINLGSDNAGNQLELVANIAKLLKLKEDEFRDTQSFTIGHLHEVQYKNRLLFIDDAESSGDPEIKHFPSPKMDGRIVVLHLPSSDTYVFRYYGNLSLFINGHNIKPNRSYIWSVGSVIKNQKIGALYFSRMSGRFIQASVENKFVFTAEEIQYSYRNSGNGLKRFNLSEDSGRLIGIIGGSGCGKSTLLNVLNGNIKPKSGSIKVNGYDIHENKELIKGVIGYVPQDDLLIKELTVYKNLYFNARLCFSDYSEEQISKLVEKALVDFDLVEARDLNVGDALNTILSGGQRKRLNIALELIREPSILFVDEPTSGLSSADSEKVITLLKRQALKGKLVITNIHQPSSDVYKMLDKLLVMDQGGRVIYYGNPITAITYFKTASKHADADESECPSCGNINSDQILRIVEARVVDSNGRLTRKRKTTPEEWYQLYLADIDVQVKQFIREHDSSVPRNNFKIPGHAKQFKLFLQRDLMSKYFNKQYLFLNILEAPLLAIILAFFTKSYIFVDGIPKYVFGENPNIPAFLFMAVIVALFMGLVISAEEIFKDRKILKREKFLNLSRSSYLFSKISILFAFSALQTLVFVAISSYMLEIRGMGIYYWLILFTASCWANLVGLIISSGLNSVVTIYIMVPIILVPQLLMSGVVVEFDKMHNKIASRDYVPLIGDMMTSRWAYEALMVSQFKYNKFENNFYLFEQEISNNVFYSSFGIPEFKKRLGECDKLLKKTSDTTRYAMDLDIVKKGISNISKELNWGIPMFIDSLTVPLYSTSVSEKSLRFLENAAYNFNVKHQNAVSKRDQIYEILVKKYGSIDAVVKLKQQYHNRQLTSIVTNEKEVVQYNIYNNELFRVKDAVYRNPDSNWGRAHFYAPVKKIMRVIIGTFWFNLIIVWLFSAVLFVLLYYDVLRKILAYFESVLLIRRNRLKLLRMLMVYEQVDKRKQRKEN